MSASLPNVTANLLSANTAQTPGERSILLIGCMTSGTATSGALVEDLTTVAEFNAAFGRTSQIAKTARGLIQQLSVSRIRPKIAAIGLADNASGVAATGNVIFGGTATAAGTITVNIDSSVNGSYSIAVASGDTASTIGAALVNAITANADSPVTAANSSGNVTLTAVNDGTQGNTIGLSVSGSVAGIIKTVIAMNSGATNPSLTGLFDPIDDIRYTTVVYPSELGLSTLITEMESRFNVDNKIIDGLGLVCANDTYANLDSGLDVLNAKTIGFICNKLNSNTSTTAIGTISGITQSAGTATVTTAAAHGLTSGMSVTIAGADQAGYNLTATITVATPTTFTYAVDSGTVSPATGTITGVVNLINYAAGGIFENPIVIAAQVAAVRELRLTVGANTSSLTTSGQGTGGNFFGAIPYHNTPFVYLPVVTSGNGFTDTEALELENSGGWLLRNNPANTVIASKEAVTTYKTNALGDADTTYKYVNYFDTLTIARAYIFNNLKADLSQHILTTGDLIQGRPMINQDAFVGIMSGYYRSLSGLDYVLLRAGSAEAKAFKQAIRDSVVITLSSGTISAESIANINTQVRNVIMNFTPTFE